MTRFVCTLAISIGLISTLIAAASLFFGVADRDELRWIAFGVVGIIFLLVGTTLAHVR